VLAIVMLFAFVDGQSAPKPAVPSDANTRQMLVDRIDLQHHSVGIVVGVIAPEERRVIAYGHLEKGQTGPPNGDTIFEIGLETKAFTSLLLAGMVRRGEVALGHPVAIMATTIASQVPPRVSFGYAWRQESTSAKRLEN
jgi:CubicO group peptidase (beta-lactamase class C family)